MVRRGMMAAALCAATLVLVGCSDDPPKPKPFDPPSKSETPTTPPTSEPPKAQSAEQFIRTWLKTSFQAQKSGETADLRALLGPRSDCKNLPDLIDKIYKAGGWVKPSTERVTAIRLKERLPDGSRTYHVDVATQPWSLKESRNAQISRRTGGRATSQYGVKSSGGRWQMMSCGVLVEPDGSS